jgi:uncharacterized protein YecE (DUF72 family)
MRTLIGTSGYSYAAWKGRFYPPKLPSKQMLRFYATQFASVEINNTFYKLPESSTIADWAVDVPARFTFAVKAPQQITHWLRLKNAAEPLREFWEATGLLGKKRGPVLFQLPPNFKKDLPLLEGFLTELPTGCRAAFEFRHASWFDDAVYQALRTAGVALCIAEDEKLATPLEPTTGWGYLRLRREDYVDADIRKWARQIAKQKWRQAFVYFKHEDEAKGPRFARLLQEYM